MRKLLLPSIISTSLLLSCSAEEQFTEIKASRLNSQDIGKALAQGFGSIEIDFSRLFEYATIEDAQKETHKAIEGITRDAQDELAQRPDCTHAHIGFIIHAGDASLVSVRFTDANERVVRENFIYFNKGSIRSYPSFNGSAELYEASQKTLATILKEIENKDLDSYIKSNLISQRGVAEFVVVVDATNTVVYGLR